MSVQAPREVELKLELDAADVPKLRMLLDTSLGASARSVHLTSIYYDTAAHDLAAAGITLRIRSGGNEQLVQTIKRHQGAQAALFQRDEWETPLAGREPDLEAFFATPAGAVLQAPDLSLSPCFETLVERTTWQVSTEGRDIEVALDRGHVVAGRHREPLVELELELKRGEPGDLFRLLRDLREVDSLQPGVLTKSERGYRLLRNKPRRASKAEPLRLTEAMTSAEAFQAIVHACLRHFGLNAPIVVAHRAPEALHQARVALRRLRSAVSLFKDLVADGEYPRLTAALRDVSQALGEARNLDVYLAESARPEARREADEPDFTAFMAEIQRRRSAAYDQAVARLQSPALRSLQMRLVEWIEAGAWRTEDDALRVAARDRPVRAIAAEILRKRHSRVKRRGKHLAKLDPEARHKVRIEAKKLRYAAEFFAGLTTGSKRQRRHMHFITALEALQDKLGELNDIQSAHDIALGFAPHPAGEAVPAGLFPAFNLRGRQDAQVGELLKAAGDAHAALIDSKRFWSDWHG